MRKKLIKNVTFLKIFNFFFFYSAIEKKKNSRKILDRIFFKINNKFFKNILKITF